MLILCNHTRGFSWIRGPKIYPLEISLFRIFFVFLSYSWYIEPDCGMKFIIWDDSISQSVWLLSISRNRDRSYLKAICPSLKRWWSRKSELMNDSALPEMYHFEKGDLSNPQLLWPTSVCYIITKEVDTLRIIYENMEITDNTNI